MIVPSLSYGNPVFRKMVVLLLLLMSSTYVVGAQQGIVLQQVNPSRQGLNAALQGDNPALQAGNPSLRGINPAPPRTPAPPHINVVALMVEFQPDTTRFTTGNGTFEGPLFEGVEAPRIDPLPHNEAYFEAHLAFLEDYIGRVSDGKTTVDSYVLPNVVRVSGKMGSYSPTGRDADSDTELGKLARLVEEAWTLAAGQGIQLPPAVTSENTAFVIFHAGVGRDIELIGTTLDKTPEDLPSLFLGEKTLTRLGISPIRVDGIDIHHSLVIPRTESRMGYDALADEPFLIELSINGLIAASFLNYLGVPDLFNTETGESAIGPFDVMDALGIFAFGGLFPPEPSAWTKAFLGWADVLAFRDAQNLDVSLSYVGHLNKNEAARIEISDAEYFLVENRHRDPENDGVQMKVWNDGVIRDVVFQNADPDFNDVTISGFEGGVVVGVDQYDFALPGGEDEFGNPLLGGLLIWHVDENRISASIESNSVNADPNRRGLDLEEADSAQDIGFASVGGGFFGPQFELGSPFDFWFKSNPVKVRTSTGQDITLYTNSFTANSHPSSHANNGSETPISITNISDPGPIATFTLDQQAQLTWNVTDRTEFEVQSQFSTQAGIIGRISGDSGSDGYPFVFGAINDNVPGNGGLPGGDYSIQTPTQRLDGLLNVWPVSGPFGVMGLSSTGFVWLDQSGSRHDFPIGSSQSITATSNLAWYSQGNQTYFRVGISGPAGYEEVKGELGSTGSFSVSTTPSVDPIRRIIQRARDSAFGLLVVGNSLVDEQALTSSTLNGPNALEQLDASVSPTQWMVAWTDPLTSMLHIEHESGSIYSASLSEFGECVPGPAVVSDLTHDDESDVLVACGRYVYGFYSNAVLIAGFPFKLEADATTIPVVAKDVATNQPVVFIQTGSGSLDAVSVGSEVTRLKGFPLSTGKGALFSPYVEGNTILTQSGNGVLSSWASIQATAWNARQVSQRDVALQQSASNSNEPVENGRLLDGVETYNWPNPITMGSTHIRFMVASESDVDITIVDAAGSFIKRFDSISVQPHIPTEVIWTTDAESGLYFARVQAKSRNSNQSDTRLIKMAVIK